MKLLSTVETLNTKGYGFYLVRNFKGLEQTKKVMQAHFRKETGRLVTMAFFNSDLPDYMVVVSKRPPNERELESMGLFPVKKDRANWLPIQYLNRDSIHHHTSRVGDYEHTTNLVKLELAGTLEYLKYRDKKNKLSVLYKKKNK